jgi:hypothetical protein
MLTSSLMLMLLACPVQDPPAPPATQDAAPAPAPASAPDAAPAVPDQTPESVRSFLNEAQAGLYDPQAAGLMSLAFDMDADVPGLGVVGAVHVTWAAGQDAQTAFTATEGLALPAQVPVQVLEAQAKSSAQQFLGSMLNRSIGSLLDVGVATMGGLQEGLVAVSHHNPTAAAQGVKSQTFYFDGESQLKKSAVVVEQETPMGAMTINMLQTFVWKPAEGSDLLVRESETLEMDLGVLGTQTGNVTYTYQQVAGIVLPLQISTLMKLPPMMGGEQKQVVAAKNLVVNGSPAPGLAPAPVEVAPEAPRPAEGG